MTDLVQIKQTLQAQKPFLYQSDLLGLRVDVALKDNLKKRIGWHILQEVETI